MLPKKTNVKNLTKMAILFAISIVLSFLEGLIPPIASLPPGIKLGLSNIAIMYCIFFIGKSQSFTLLLLKSLFVFLTRGFTAFLMSFSGGLFSLFIIIFLLSLKKLNISYIIISVYAAIFHNIAQILVSCLLLGSFATLFYLPILIISGIVMGIITGTILKVIIPTLTRIN